MRLTVFAIALLLAPVVSAAAAGDEDVVVYTNADVEKLAPLPTGSLPVNAEFDAEAWAFVAEFVERERAKITSDRDHELERDRVAIEADRPVGHGERYPYYLRVPFYEPLRPQPRTAPEPDGDAPGSTPHPMFLERPPVREFTPGWGTSIEGAPESSALDRVRAGLYNPALDP